MTPGESRKAETPAMPQGMEALVADLNCDSKIKCRNARLALVQRGQPAVEPLISALENGREIVPLEAAKALGKIGSPRAVRALIDALEDERFEVRWEAAEALVKTGREAVKPLLKILVKKGASTWVRDGAHHVFSEMEDTGLFPQLKPVLAALDDEMPRLEVPLAAQKLLDKLVR